MHFMPDCRSEFRGHPSQAFVFSIKEVHLGHIVSDRKRQKGKHS